ncbi:MAG: hypothetical protein HKP40_12830 [Litoreibacter sp.]|nr:hypothetical protein [Litoreibacter sp.]
MNTTPENADIDEIVQLLHAHPDRVSDAKRAVRRMLAEDPGMQAARARKWQRPAPAADDLDDLFDNLPV